MRRRLRPPSTTVIPREGGESSTLRLLGSIITVSEYWIARANRAMTASVWTQTRLRVVAAKIARALPGHSTLKPKRAQGRPGADLAPAVRCAKSTRRKTAQQHTGVANHSAFPARWLDGLCRALPGAEFSLASLVPAKVTDTAPVDANAASARA